MCFVIYKYIFRNKYLFIALNILGYVGKIYNITVYMYFIYKYVCIKVFQFQLVTPDNVEKESEYLCQIVYLAPRRSNSPLV